MMVQVFRCGLCGHLFRDNKSYVAKSYDDADNQLGELDAVAFRPHYCDDGNIGAARYVGFVRKLSEDDE